MLHPLKRELAGLELEVVKAANQDLVGIHGKVLDETKHTLIVETDKGRKRLLKEQITFIVKIDNRRIEIDGKKINKNPEKRT